VLQGQQLISDVYRVSPAQTADVAEIKRIEIECMLSPWTVDSYLRELESEESVVLKAVNRDETILGFLLGRAPRGIEAGIYNIGTVSAFRRKGVGSLLLAEFRKQAVERSSSEIWLEVRASNRPAINFYLSKGFVSRGVRKNFYTNPVDDALVMSLSLRAV
jgi:ribosomal-protein-alanine N-acetyltransferase